MKVFVIDVARCNGCYNCQIACKDEHCGQPWLPIAEAQPEIGQFWLKMTEKERGQIPVVKVSYQPTLCNHCEDAPCMQAAEAAGAADAVYRREDGLVIVDPEKAKGCREIADACPMGAIYWNEELGLAQKCTGCAHLLDAGWKAPRCVDSCATGALQFGEAEDFDLSGAECMSGMEGLGSHVYYRNLPKRFVAGLTFDPEVQEVVTGAKVELIADGEIVSQTITDFFGDFKFDQVDPKNYTVRISAEGFKDVELAADLSDIDLYVGDIPMEK